jgi:hypothetical protein
MLCHECARTALEAPSVGQCRVCLVGLCKEHLVAALHSTVVPQYGCDHYPERPFAEPDRSPGSPQRRVSLPDLGGSPAIGVRIRKSPA